MTVIWSDENVLKLIVMMDVRLCEYMSHHLITHSRWVNYIQCKLQISKVLTRKVNWALIIRVTLHLSSQDCWETG